MFDIFYSGSRPGLFAHEREADSIEHARKQSRTRYFWWVTYLADLTTWDFLWEPPPWQQHQRHAWPNQHQPDSGVYLVPCDWDGQETNYHATPQIHHRADPQHWRIPEWIDARSIDPAWSPDPAAPPYIYEFPVEWGWNHVGGPEYHVPGAKERKYVWDFVARTRPDPAAWYQHRRVEWTEELQRWRPDPTDPPYIYVFGNQWWPAEIMPTVEYRVPGATERKYMDLTARLPERHDCHWHTIYDCEWDYSWVPDPGDPPYIYVWGNQWWPAEKMPTVEYHVPGATERKYMDRPALLLSDDQYWHIPDYIDAASVDRSWRPDPGDPAYIYEFATQWQPTGGARYVVPGATEVKYVPIQHRRLPDHRHWSVPDCVDANSVDFSWHPDTTDQPYIYEFATQWQANGGARYVVPGATEVKYVPIQHRRLSLGSDAWQVLAPCEFDFSWHPDCTEDAYIYVFGNQHYPANIMPTVRYHMAGATQEKFVDAPYAKLAESRDHWQILEPIAESEWDWTWRPDPGEPAYIYVWGNQWNAAEYKASIRYCVPGATDVKYMPGTTRRLPDPSRFRFNLAVADFDYSWEPNPFDPPMTYVFGNQWNSSVLEPTVIYSTGGSEIKYMDAPVAQVAQDITAWTVLDDIEKFDYSWRPDPTDPPYIYVFGNQWLRPEQRPALEYPVAGATERKYMDHPRAQRRGDASRFQMLYPCDFDWSWEPDPGSPPYEYVFGNQYYSAEVMPTVIYAMPSASERKYMDIAAQLLPQPGPQWKMVIEAEWDHTWRPEPGSPPYIYVFGNQWWPAEIMPTVEYHMPGATERKYMAAPTAQLRVDLTHWHVPAFVDVTDMDFSWRPDPGEPPYIYQFATQHQKTGGPQYRMPGATEFKYVDMMRAEVQREAAPIFEIDHMDGNAGQIPGTVRRVRYFDNYRDTLIRLAKSLVGEYEHVWVCSSVCDYTDFDFTWHPESWQSTQLHVFASDEQKFGDTFYMHVPTFAERAEKKQLLEWYSVNYVPRRRVPRRPMPVILHDQDSHVDTVRHSQFTAPLALFTVEPHVDRPLVTVPLWREEVKTITPISSGAASVIVPRVAVPYIRTQLYDYPHIDRTGVRLRSQLLDIVFISNGESNAEHHWRNLQQLVPTTDRIHRVDGVNGRAAAYHAAARVSTTPWFFAVFAKLDVDARFDWAWQPDRMQQPKHYIFHARNPCNRLVYGHQAIIAYNRDLVLSNPGVGLDFTLDSAHEVVPMVSGVARYNTDAWTAWRTAFRETIKLRASLPDVENEYRLAQWLTGGEGPYGEWSVQGAEDAVAYYDEVGGDFEQLRKSYEWAWLASYAFMRRQLLPV